MPSQDYRDTAPSRQAPRRKRSQRDIERDKGRKRNGVNRKVKRRDPSTFKDPSANRLFFEPYVPRKIKPVYARAEVLAAIRATGGKIDRQKLAAMLWGTV